MKLLMFILLFGLIASTQATEIEIEYKSWISGSDRQHVETWLKHGVKATERSLGILQQDTLPFIIEPSLFASEPVPWATVQRGKPDAVLLQIKRFTSSRVLIKDWTLYHEIAHLYHPLLDHSDFWLAEGLATYLQNVIMLENDIFNVAEFRTRLISGLSRGAKNTRMNKGALKTVSEQMWSLNAQQRVYWSGVAFFIEAEIALQDTGNKNTIRALISSFQQCCKGSVISGDRNSGRLFIASLDKLSKTTIFSNLYANYKQRKDFPDLSKAQIYSLQPLR
ncbi:MULTISPECIES: hypothetical protein [Pseudoalteromonas]|uniref:M61 family metallopeptidase n=1 Tax=Pseudoalteromonas TaxID=53246 RepID=UPI0019D0C11A|nr:MULTISPECIES: hypothetical protein [Pseudoalteromonas]MBR8844645.1 hypothetical protein [Pseudoalteromonas sp. JC3]UDM61860.1 hypothetical protein KIJ96_00910 [Pseudoalteromonas piscicida]WJE10474.1 hypothetical protein QSH61_08465 [Pseudoalteromonas sp. JC3]